MKWLHDWFSFTPGFKIVMLLVFLGSVLVWYVLA